MSQFFPQGKFLIVCFVACFDFICLLLLLLLFFFLRCFRREARWVFEVSLNHSPDYKTNHSTSPDARHVILRKQLSYSYVLDN